MRISRASITMLLVLAQLLIALYNLTHLSTYLPTASGLALTLLLVLYYLLMPGYLMTSILNIYPHSVGKRLLASVGLSVGTFMMLYLSSNVTLSALGVKTPLSSTNVNLIATAFLITLALLHCFRGKKFSLEKQRRPSLTIPSKVWILISLLTLPMLSVAGISLMNATGENYLVVLSIFTTLFFVGVLLFRSQNDWLYPLGVYVIGASLLLMTGLASPHVMGWDVHGEYAVYEATSKASLWDVTHLKGNMYYLAMSVTVLPTVLNRLTGLSGELIFKLVYPLLFSLIPVAIFYISGPILKEKRYAFLGSLYFIGQLVFLSLPSVIKTGFGILFFSLAILLMFEAQGGWTSRFLFAIFTISTVLSHYGVSLIFAGILSITWVMTQLKIKKSRIVERKYILASTALLVTVLTLFWYGQVSEVSLEKIANYLTTAVANLMRAFDYELRSHVVYEASGAVGSISDSIMWIVQTLGRVFVIIGALFLFLKRPKNVAKEFSIMGVLFVLSLIGFALLPYFSKGYSLERVYLQALVVLSLSFVIGGILALNVLPHAMGSWLNRKFSRLALSKNKVFAILALMIQIQLLLVCGIAGWVVGDTRAVWLTKDSEPYWAFYVTDQEVISAQWVSSRSEAWVYCDIQAQLRLESYGGLFRGWRTRPLSDHFVGLLYLSKQNHLRGEVGVFDEVGVLKMVSLDRYVDVEGDPRVSKVYCNGASSIYLVNITGKS